MASTTDVNSEIVKGSIWMVALRLSVKGIGLVSTMVLARLLMPEDFGLVALAMSLYAFVELINAFGFGVALIQNQQATEEHYHTAWTLRVCFSLVAALVLSIAAVPAAHYFHDERLAAVVTAISVLFVIGALGNIGVVNFQKEMRFRKTFQLSISVKIISFICTISLAVWLRNYWALIGGMFIARVSSLLISYRMHPFRPRFSLSKTREIMGFSGWLLINNFLFFLNNHGQNFIISKFSGTSSLGLFSVSNEIATLTTAEIVGPVNRAAYPGYAKISHDREKLKATYLQVLGNIATISIPSAFGLSLIAPVFVPVILGEKWLESIFIIQLIAISSIFSSLGTNTGYVFLALAKQKITTLMTSCRLIILLSLLLYFVPENGVIGAAYSILITTFVMYPVNILVLTRYMNLRLMELLKIFLRPFIATIVMGASVYFLVSLVTVTELNLAGIGTLVGCVVAGAVIYGLAIYLLWLASGKPSGPETVFIGTLVERYKRA